LLDPARPTAAVEGGGAGVYTRTMIEGDDEQALRAAAGGEPDAAVECPRCGKLTALCVCQDIAPDDNAIELLILQHPQEQDRVLGTAKLTALHFKRAILKVGLSWPSLSRILGRQVDPQRWAVLYLGSLKASDLAPGSDIVVVDRKGQPEADQRGILRGIEGVVLLDGSWSQAKALWWRNAWMLKCRRTILGPKLPSRYGHLRREPRPDGLATIEAAAILLGRLSQNQGVERRLIASFERLLDRYRQLQKTTPGFDRPHSAAKRGRFKGARQTRRRLGRS
jgi:DTW domain-containing protein YfiP